MALGAEIQEKPDSQARNYISRGMVTGNTSSRLAAIAALLPRESVLYAPYGPFISPSSA